MLEAWRVTKAAYARTAFDGEGARRAGGRFNSKGTAVVYAADSLALALLEVAVHLPSYHGLRGRVAFRLTFEASIVNTLTESDLPADWRSMPPARATQQLGDAWVREGQSAVLRVPSVVVPGAYNLVLNPAHEDFSRIEIEEPFPVPIDERLVK